jgi:hypothetical protein
MEDPTRLSIVPLYGREQLNKGPLERALKDAERARFILLKRDLKPAFYLKPEYLWAVFDHNGGVCTARNTLKRLKGVIRSPSEQSIRLSYIVEGQSRQVQFSHPNRI